MQMEHFRTLLKDNDINTAASEEPSLKVLIVDDEPTVHEITELVLKRFRYRGYKLNLVSAYSATEAREVLAEQGPFALILLDVIMETDDAGLTLARYIREELNDQMVRIILRTGEPGMVPQRQVMRDYEIDDYKEKAELTSERFDATVTASIRTYLGFRHLEESRQGLIRVLDAIREVDSSETNVSLDNRILEQVEEIMNRSGNPGLGSLLISDTGEKKTIVTASGSLKRLGESDLDALEDTHTVKIIKEAMAKGSTVHDGNHIMTTLLTSDGGRYLAYFEDVQEFKDTDRYLVELYASHVNVSVRYHGFLPKADSVQQTKNF